MINSLGNSIPRNGLAGEWLLDGNRLDTSGNGYNGTATNVTYTKTTKGYQAQAGSFNGSSSQIALGTISSYTNISFSFWFYPTNVSKTNQWLFGYSSGTTGIYLSYNHVTSNQLTFVNEPSGLKINCGTLSNNTWYHIVATRDNSGNGKVYINAGLPITGTLNTNSGTNPLTIGFQSGGVNFTQGQIELARIYNRVLSQDEIQLLYLEGLRKLGPTNIRAYPKLLDGLVGYWDFRGTRHNLVDGTLATVSGATLTTDRFGYSNGAYSFNGSSNYIQKTSTLSDIADSFTIDLWMNKSVNTDSKTPISIRPTSGAINIIQCETYNTNYLRVVVYSSNGTTFKDYKTTTTSLNTGTWYKVTISYSANVLNIYINGILQSVTKTTDGSLSLTGTSRNLTIGRETTGSNFFNGNIGEVMILNKVLSADEISSLYKLTSQDYIYPSPSYDIASLREGLVLDISGNNNGTTWYDISGSGNNGTISGTLTSGRIGKKRFITSAGNNGLSITRNSGLEPTTGTVSSWIKTSTKTRACTIIGINNVINADTYGYCLWMNTSGFLVGEVDSATTYNQNVGTVDIADGKRHLVTMKWDGTNIKTYLDGKLHKSISQTITVAYNNQDLKIGFDSTNATRYVTGDLGGQRIRNRVLSDTEIQQLYYSQKANFIY